ncbi:TniQ family protein [Streptomyces sp. NPDC051561]|uniref:TniQ family protein n=1 Tax=Streptomyces sp. NPDC051561 TaxID=3365658 RepID=UPI00379886B8
MPIRYPPNPGEALDSWLEYLAHRLHCRLGDVLHALDLPYNDHDPPNAFTRHWTTLVTPEELTAIHQVTGVPQDVLAAMTLQPFDHHAVVIDPERRRVHRQSLWGRTGSRFCPACLADSNGRWPLTWRLGWSFACTRHHVLLADRCPSCSRIPRFITHPRSETPCPGLCASPAQGGGPRRRRCHHPWPQPRSPRSPPAAGWRRHRA